MGTVVVRILHVNLLGPPCRTRTCNLLLRRQLLYPVELRDPRREHRLSHRLILPLASCQTLNGFEQLLVGELRLAQTAMAMFKFLSRAAGAGIIAPWISPS